MSYFLYAEDDQDDIDILTEALKGEEKKTAVVSVTDGYELLKYLQHIKPNDAYPSLIILDMKLPRLDGMETLQLLKTDDMYRLIPVVIFSSKASESEHSYCKALGVEVLSKPVGFQDWRHIIDSMCSYVDEE